MAAAELDVENAGKRQVYVNCRVDNPGADGRTNCISESILFTAPPSAFRLFAARRALPLAFFFDGMLR